MALQTSSMVIVALVPLILWRLYSRFRRLVGRQRSRAWRHWTAAIFYPLVIVLLAIPAMLNPYSLAALGAGIATGIALAVFGLKVTLYEATPEGFFYTPHAHIGIGLSLLLVLRIGYRFYQISQMGAAPPPGHMQDFTRSPLTLVIIGMVASYYTAYAIGILRWRARTMVPSVPTESTP
jgi:cytochrome b561